MEDGNIRLRKKRIYTVCGVGINDAEHVVTRNTKDMDGKIISRWICPYFSVWKSIISRCYAKTKGLHLKTYKNTTVCKEWHIFSNFYSWCKENNYTPNKSNCLDKDLVYLITDNQCDGKIYSPSTCSILTPTANNYLKSAKRARGDCMLGVTKDQTGKYSAVIPVYGRNKHLGSFNDEYEAHCAWRGEKISYGISIAKEIEDDLSYRRFLMFIDKLKREQHERLVTEY